VLDILAGCSDAIIINVPHSDTVGNAQYLATKGEITDISAKGLSSAVSDTSHVEMYA